MTVAAMREHEIRVTPVCDGLIQCYVPHEFFYNELRNHIDAPGYFRFFTREVAVMIFVKTQRTFLHFKIV